MKAGEAHMILNVDDDEGSRYAKSRILRRAGYEVFEAGTGAEALGLVKEKSPELILLDVRLPDISGPEVCRRIKQDPATNHIMVLQISASNITAPDRVLGLECGADSYLTEPVESTELTATIAALLRLYNREEENRQLVAQLREADRKKNEFLAILAHELRNPLHAIYAAVEVLTGYEHHDSEHRLTCQVINQQVNHLSRLIDDLLDVARITRDKLELRKARVDFAEVVRNAVEASRANVESRGHRLQLALPPPGLQIEVDTTRLSQIIENLLDNAAKYTPPGGMVWVNAAAEDSRAVVSVKDNGIGIAGDKLGRVFEMFYQVDSSLERTTSGLGLGLNLARRLVELHGGTIAARSEGLGRGSEFIVSLPVVAGSAATEEPRVARGAARDPLQRRILIVDDSARIREMYELLLTKRGHIVETAADGPTSIAMVQTFKPDVVLLDVGMPRMNGFDACKQIRSLPDAESIVMIAVTGWGKDDVKERADESGFDAILVKPAAVQDILSVAQTVAEKRKSA